MKVLVLDNYDSFVYNLVQLIGELGGEPLVHRSDQVDLASIAELNPDRIVISPGPGRPEDERYFGVCTAVIRRLGVKTPVLGVCLGHQGIAHAFGGRVVGAGRLMHGKTSMVRHDGLGMYRGVKNPLKATRYHSLVVDRASLPGCLKVTAEALDDGEVMGIRHVEYPVEGVQFHPESIMTEDGVRILKNFLDGEEP